MIIPPEARAAVDALLVALAPSKGTRLVLVVNAYRHPSGELSVDVTLPSGEKFRHVVRNSRAPEGGTCIAGSNERRR